MIGSQNQRKIASALSNATVQTTIANVVDLRLSLQLLTRIAASRQSIAAGLQNERNTVGSRARRRRLDLFYAGGGRTP
jgi:hypothetical protein